MPDGVFGDPEVGRENGEVIDDEDMTEGGEGEEKGEEEPATDDECIEDELIQPETVLSHESQPDLDTEGEDEGCEKAEEVPGATRQPGHLRGMEIEVEEGRKAGGEAKTVAKQPDLEPQNEEDSEDDKGEAHTTKGVHKDPFKYLLMKIPMTLVLVPRPCNVFALGCAARTANL